MQVLLWTNNNISNVTKHPLANSNRYFKKSKSEQAAWKANINNSFAKVVKFYEYNYLYLFASVTNYTFSIYFIDSNNSIANNIILIKKIKLNNSGI